MSKKIKNRICKKIKKKRQKNIIHIPIYYEKLIKNYIRIIIETLIIKQNMKNKYVVSQVYGLRSIVNYFSKSFIINGNNILFNDKRLYFYLQEFEFYFVIRMGTTIDLFMHPII